MRGRHLQGRNPATIPHLARRFLRRQHAWRRGWLAGRLPIYECVRPGCGYWKAPW